MDRYNREERKSTKIWGVDKTARTCRILLDIPRVIGDMVKDESSKCVILTDRAIILGVHQVLLI